MTNPALSSRFFAPALFAFALISACSGSEDPDAGGDGDTAGDGDGIGDGDTSGDGDGVGGGDGDGNGSGGSEGSGATAGDGDAPGSGSSSGTGGGGNAVKKTYLYVGSGVWGDAEPGKVTVYDLDRASRLLSYSSEVNAGGLASFLAIDTQNLRLFSADEDQGGIFSYSIDAATGALTPQGTKVGSNNPVYLTLTPNADYLLAANYSQGSVDVFPIGSDGTVQPLVQSENTGQNAHCIVMDSTGRVLVANEGSDTISRFTYSSGLLTPEDPATSPHTSPRHIIFDDQDRPYVVSESENAITRYVFEANGALSIDFQEARLPGAEPPASNTGADIALTPDGSFLYASNRGSSNTIAAYDLRSGTAVLVEHESTGGTTPRNISMDPQGEFLVVGNRESNNITIFDIGDDGALELVLNEPTTVSPYFVQVVEL